MKKFLLTLLAVFLFGGAISAQTAHCPAGPRFYPDVPTGHWASTAVSRLSDLGIIIGFPDGLYRGNENLTRYQAALMFFRLIECYFPIIPQSSLGQADLDALRRAIGELTGSLAAIDATARGAADSARTAEALARSNANGIANNAASIAAIETTVLSLSGSVASNTQRLDSLAGLHSRIEEIQRSIANFSMPSMPGGVSDELLQGIRNQLQALQVKSDTALATAQKALALAEGEVDLTAIQARINQNKRSIDNLDELAESLNGDVANLQERVTILEGHEHAPVETAAAVDLSGIEGEVANIREFSLLLRRRQIGLENRVTALEARSGDVDALARRVDIIEGQLFQFTGTLLLNYNVRRHSIFDRNANGDPIVGPGGQFRYDRFDVDRIFGEGFIRDMPVTGGHSFVSTGNGDDDDEDDFERKTDFNGPREGRVGADIEIAFGFANGSSGCGFPRKLDCFSGIIDLELVEITADNIRTVETNPRTDLIYAFNFRNAELHYSPIGGNSNLKLEFGRDLDIDFTGYVVDTGDSDIDDEDNIDNYFDLSSGFAAHFDATDYIGDISPKLTFFYGTNPAREGANNARYAWGARAQVSLLEDNVTIGGSFATVAEGAGDFNDELKDNVGVSVFGADGHVNIGIFDLQAEFASETINAADNAGQVSFIDANATPNTFANGDTTHSLFYAILGIDTQAVRLGDNIRLTSLEANYRTIPGDWFGLNGDDPQKNPRQFGQEDDIGEISPFDLDQKGFGAKAGAKLFIFRFDAYVDTYDINVDIANSEIKTTAFGLEGDVDIFAGIAVTGFFRSVSIDDGNGSEVVDSTQLNRTFTQDSDTPLIPGIETTRDDARYVNREFYDDDNDDYTTGFGVGLKHSGRSKDAIIRNLNAEFIFGRINAGFDTTLINLDADYKLDIGPLALRPYFGFLKLTNDGAENDGANIRLADRARIEVGTDLVTKPVDVIFRPSLLGAVNYWSTNYEFDNSNNNFTANAFQFSVGLKLNQFLFKHSALTAKYGSYTGENIRVSNSPNTSPSTDNNTVGVHNAFDRNEAGVKVDGFEFIWNYYDLELAYGIFNYDPNTTSGVENDDSQGQAFRIKYRVTF